MLPMSRSWVCRTALIFFNTWLVCFTISFSTTSFVFGSTGSWPDTNTKLPIRVACGDKYEGDFSYKIKDFSFTDQDGETFNKEDLDGKFWVADLVFTNCTDVCPPMIANMASLQQKLVDEDMNDVHLVSFTVDPDRDKPEDLKEYSKERGGHKLW